MCGIAGIFSYRGPAAASAHAVELQRMLDHMAARGPDGAGQWTSSDGALILGHRRLAIIDLDERGAQPMHAADHAAVVVFNGEIYNFRELKKELISNGAVFVTESDTEVLLHMYRRYGDAMVTRLRGMFAFALWDATRRRLFLARDAFGIKPLYVADDGRVLRFASQVKALVAGGVSSEPSAAGAAGFFVWGHVPEPWTWVSSVKAVPAGATLTVSVDESPGVPRRYFDLREEIAQAEAAKPLQVVQAAQGRQSHAVAKSPGDAAFEAIADSVRCHLVSDVPVGVFLSAGRDSSLIATLAARTLAEPLRTVTLAFAEYRGTIRDEAPTAAAIARELDALHCTEAVTQQDFAAEHDKLLGAMDQPTIDGVNTYFVSRAAARSGLKVVLSGLGGDELFGGYSTFREVPQLTGQLGALRLVPWLGRAVRVVTSSLLSRLSRPKWAGVLEYGTSIAGAYLLRRALFMPWEVPALMDPQLARRGLEDLGLLDDLQERIRGIRSPAAAVMALEMSCYMGNQLLRDADWAGMAHSLEIRVPLVDRELFRRWLPFAIESLPYDRNSLLARASPGVTSLVQGRPKTGFGTPVQQWLRHVTATDVDRGLRPWAQMVERFFGSLSRGCAL